MLSANHLNAIFFENEILVQLDSKRQAAHAGSGSFGLRGLVFEIWISVYHPKWLIHMYENNYRQTTQMQDATFFQGDIHNHVTKFHGPERPWKVPSVD